MQTTALEMPPVECMIEFFMFLGEVNGWAWAVGVLHAFSRFKLALKHVLLKE